VCGCLPLTFALTGAVYKVIKNSSTFSNLPSFESPKDTSPMSQVLLISALVFSFILLSIAAHPFICLFLSPVLRQFSRDSVKKSCLRYSASLNDHIQNDLQRVEMHRTLVNFMAFSPQVNYTD
jgi:hypothetical protein